ncbi:hypothetical protein VHEMI01316 [[Torrubiella] hemipterigena]|uniref:Uncharacterized protein n=1 Tax=[Torrubiella] hemipterigena TaxID=1531966 RepID=A0A0A1T4G5_9HYPO|nr:hypothetical protein VHEMI01316 [[Torrubiella] hemipterigena]
MHFLTSITACLLPALAAAAPNIDVITGVRSDHTYDPRIIISDIAGTAKWTWTKADVANQSMPADLRKCMDGASATDAKWVSGGNAIVVIYSYAALLINHQPGSATDKQLLYGLCLSGNGLGNTHSLELLPNNKLAIANDNSGMSQSINIYNMSSTLEAYPKPAQQIHLMPAVHALVWDDKRQLLWAAGNDQPPYGKAESRALLNAYRFNDGTIDETPYHSYNVSAPLRLTTENGNDTLWWEGSHDLTPLPDEDKLIVTTDAEMYLFDIATETFTHGEAVAKQYFPGFESVDRRVGSDGVNLPRSDLKSVSVVDGMALYTQAPWTNTFPTRVNVLVQGKKQPDLYSGSALYKSRWFTEIRGWPKPTLGNL